jgi:hypothetical protein
LTLYLLLDQFTWFLGVIFLPSFHLSKNNPGLRPGVNSLVLRTQN